MPRPTVWRTARSERVNNNNSCTLVLQSYSVLVSLVLFSLQGRLHNNWEWRLRLPVSRQRIQSMPIRRRLQWVRELVVITSSDSHILHK